MNLVHAPENFVFRDAIAHKSPSEVREILKSHAFTPHLRAKESTARDQLKANRKSEIWIRRDTHAFWAVRLDAQGHNVASGRSSKGLWAKHHGSRPHYHKDWVQDVRTSRITPITPWIQPSPTQMRGNPSALTSSAQRTVCWLLCSTSNDNS